MFEATISTRFSAGHRLLNHDGKCRFPHGHSYRAEISVAAAEIGSDDWIEDFGTLKDIAKSVIAETVDHAFILDSRDTSLITALEAVEPVKLYILQDKAPTAERIAEELFRLLRAEIPAVSGVRLWETELQSAAFAEESD